jgi:hypothetical protein
MTQYIKTGPGWGKARGEVGTYPGCDRTGPWACEPVPTRVCELREGDEIVYAAGGGWGPDMVGVQRTVGEERDGGRALYRGPDRCGVVDGNPNWPWAFVRRTRFDDAPAQPQHKEESCSGSHSPSQASQSPSSCSNSGATSSDRSDDVLAVERIEHINTAGYLSDVESRASWWAMRPRYVAEAQERARDEVRRIVEMDRATYPDGWPINPETQRLWDLDMPEDGKGNVVARWARGGGR